MNYLTPRLFPILLRALCLGCTLAASLALAAPLPDILPRPADFAAWNALYQKSPDDPQIALGFAEAALASKRTQEAVAAYERFLAKNPQHPLVPTLRARLAQLHQDAHSSSGASAHWQGYVDNSRANRQLTQERMNQARAASPWQIHGRLSAGVLFDSNANQGPASNSMSLGNWNVTLDDAKEKSTFGAYLGGGLDIGHRLGDSPNWQAVADVKFHLRGNENNDLGKVHNRYTQWYRAAAGLRWANERNLVDVRLKGEVYGYEFDTHVSAAGLELLYIHALTRSLHLISRAGLDSRDYTGGSDGSSVRNGVYTTAGQYVRIFLGDAPYAGQGDKRRHEFLFGARYLGGNADKKMYSHDGWEGMARFRMMLPHQVELGPYLRYTQESYRGPATVLETRDRKDKRLSLGLNASWQFAKNQTFEAGYQYTKNNSNSNLYDYDRHVVSMGVAWSF
jgi:hypothetical protein